jgi:hypothetical protein
MATNTNTWHRGGHLELLFSFYFFSLLAVRGITILGPEGRVALPFLFLPIFPPSQFRASA